MLFELTFQVLLFQVVSGEIISAIFILCKHTHTHMHLSDFHLVESLFSACSQ